MSTHQSSIWSDLPPELLELVLQRLTLMDYLTCRQVCLSWRSVVDDALRTKGKCPPAPAFPFMLLLSDPAPGSNLPNLLNLNQNRVYTMPTNTWVGGNRVRTVEGWLMFQRLYYMNRENLTYCQLSFFNPVSRARFNLPALSCNYYHSTSFCYNKIAFSSAPDSPEFLTAFYHEDQLRPQLAFCKVTHTSWTFIEIVESRPINFRNIVVHNRKLYGTEYRGASTVIVFNLEDVNAVTVERLVMLESIPIRRVYHTEFRSGVCHVTNHEINILAMDSIRGELLSVLWLRDEIRNTKDRSKHGVWTKGFRLFKLDIPGRRWLEVNNIGDRILLLDWTGVRVISGSDLNCPGEFNGGNCIFFCFANTFFMDSFMKHDLGVFYLANKRIRRFPTTFSFPVSVCDVWFTPSPW